MSESRKKQFIFTTTIILMSIYLIWRAIFSLPLDEDLPQIIFGVVLLISEIVTTLTTFELFYQKSRTDDGSLELPEIDDDDYPHIDVFIATHNEDCSILWPTVNACTFFDYPDKSKVHIYLCDDGYRDEVRELAKELGVGYIGLQNNKHAKSGNYNNALANTSSPLIATFDADMIPQSSFLMKTVPYFLLDQYEKVDGSWQKKEKDPNFKMGIIQTPQSFYNADLFQHNLFLEHHIPNEQNFFSNEVNLMRNKSNSIAYTGSNTVLSRQALEDIGGFPYHTITEDFQTSIMIQKKGYITHATEEVLASGLTTTDFSAMIKQRKRWARGVIQSCQNTKPVSSKELPLSGRISYLTSYFYWWSFFNRLVFIMAPIMFALFDFKIVDITLPELLIFWLPAYIFNHLSLKYIYSDVRSQKWSQIVDTIMAPYLIVPVILESLHIKQLKFGVTSKQKSTKAAKFSQGIPYFILFGLSIAALIRFTSGKYGISLFYGIIIIFWICMNLVPIMYAILFIIGGMKREPELKRYLDEEIKIKVLNKEISGIASYLHDDVFCFNCELPYYIPDNQVLDASIDSDKYHANLTVELHFVEMIGDQYSYKSNISPKTKEDERHFSQIVHDRDHMLPITLDKWMMTYDDFILFIKRFFNHSARPELEDTLSEISLDKDYVFADGRRRRVYRTNYQTVTIDARVHDYHELRITKDVVLKLRKAQYNYEYGAYDYDICNLHEVLEKISAKELNDILARL